MEWSKAIIGFLGEDVPSDELLNEKFTALLSEHASLSTDKEGLEGEVTQLKTEKAELEKLKPMAEVGEQYLKDMRNEAVCLYKILKGDEASEGMIKLYEDANIGEAKTHVEELRKEVEKSIPGVCPHCGKQVEKLSRRSSKELSEEQQKLLDRQSYQTR